MASGQATRHDALPDDRQADRDAVIDALSALRRAKPRHARALGWRYREIMQFSPVRRVAVVVGRLFAVGDMSLTREVVVIGRVPARDGP